MKQDPVSKKKTHKSWCGLSGRATCLVSAGPLVQPPILPKKRKKEEERPGKIISV
jgi:hypothetical protein